MYTTTLTHTLPYSSTCCVQRVCMLINKDGKLKKYEDI